MLKQDLISCFIMTCLIKGKKVWCKKEIFHTKICTCGPKFAGCEKGMVIIMDNKGLKLAPIFCDRMVLQRDTVNYIYGSDPETDEVTITLAGAEFCAKADEKHEFRISLPPMKAGGPYDLRIIGSSEIRITDVLFGDVYICSGQSNMELPVRRVLKVSEQEVRNTKDPTIRQYLIPASYNFTAPEKYMPESSWEEAQGEALLNFSAVGYFFAKEIKDIYQIPIGLIMTAVGGSTVEAWMSPTTLRSFGDYEERVEAFKDIDYFNTFILEQQKAAEEWGDELAKEEDTFLFDEEYKEWETCQVPSLIAEGGKDSFQGSLYLCREVILEDEPDGEAVLSMGAIIDSDMIWINGSFVGGTQYRYPPRVYSIPAGILKKGLNLITVRMVINNGKGGTIPGMPYYLKYDNQIISLEGEWHWRIGREAQLPMPGVLFPPLLPISFYHTVVVPLSKIAVKGILWYQGESNTGAPANYADLFKAFVIDWRELFGWEVPFVYAQLTNYREPLSTMDDTGWAEIREQQRRGLSLPKVAMVATLDIGEDCDLHPQNKKEVGRRMAKAARSLIYEDGQAMYTPDLISAAVEGSKVILTFQYLGEESLDSVINNFELAGSDEHYYPAHAVRNGMYVTVSCSEVEQPVYVRYAWYDNPTKINFFNEFGLPAPCFRMGPLI